MSCSFSEFTHLNLYKIQAINHDENQGSTFFTFFLCIFSMCRASFEVNGNPPCGRDSKWYKTEWELSLSSISHIQGQKYTHIQRKRYHTISKLWVESGYFTKNNPESFFKRERRSTLVIIYYKISEYLIYVRQHTKTTRINKNQNKKRPSPWTSWSLRTNGGIDTKQRCTQINTELLLWLVQLPRSGSVR